MVSHQYRKRPQNLNRIMKSLPLRAQMSMAQKIIDRLQIAAIGVFTAFFAFLGFILLPLGQANALRIASKLWAKCLFGITGVKVVVNNPHSRQFYRENKFIFVSNHESNYDIPALFTAIPEALFFIAKKELQKVPFMGWYMWAVGMIFIDRGNREKSKKSMIKAGEQIKRGKNVMSFPEGTRSRSGKVEQFKKGSFMLSRNTGIPIIPVSIKGAAECIPAGKFEIHPGTIEINIGHPVYPDEMKELSPAQFAEAIRQKVLDLRAGKEVAGTPRS